MLTDHPKDAETGRYACTKEHPMPAEHMGQWIHRDAVSVRLDDPYYDHYRCPYCGEGWANEVAE